MTRLFYRRRDRPTKRAADLTNQTKRAANLANQTKRAADLAILSPEIKAQLRDFYQDAVSYTTVKKFKFKLIENISNLKYFNVTDSM